MDIIIGAIISIAGTLIFNIWQSSRTESKRWDPDRLKALTSARKDVKRALGKIEAMAAKLIPVLEPGIRPEIIETVLDEAWYLLEELAVLFPIIETDAKLLQAALVARVDFCFTCLDQADSISHFKAHMHPSENSVREIEERVLRKCQEIVGIK